MFRKTSIPTTMVDYLINQDFFLELPGHISMQCHEEVDTSKKLLLLQVYLALLKAPKKTQGSNLLTLIIEMKIKTF